MTAVRLVHATAAELLTKLPPACVDLVLLDPPWLYGGAAPPGHGRADDHYAGMPVGSIVRDFAACARVSKAWAVLWTTWPVLAEVFAHVAALPVFPWQYVTGGSWHKHGKRGIGHHVLGDSEPWTLWRVGASARTLEQASNAHTTKRLGHSRKPAEVVAQHVRAWSPPGGLVLDPYAGEHATFAKVALDQGRRYLGAEADLARFCRASKVLAHYSQIKGSR